MALENTNLVHAVANFTLINPPTIAHSAGIDETLGIVRNGVGLYEFAAKEPIDSPEGVVLATLQADAAGEVAVVIRDLSTFGPRNILIQLWNPAGALADLGACAIQILKFPTVA
jgi:hypothetical protein